MMIPYGMHKIEQDDIDAVISVLKSGMLTCGSVVKQFEDSLSQTVNSKYSVSCSSGTAALHLCMLSLGISPGDTVLVPGITFLASANAASYVGADIVFVDVDPNTGLMTSKTLEKAILGSQDKNLKAVVNVHMAGQCENLETIYKVARKYNLFIIEDAAHAIGSNYVSQDGKTFPIGSNTFSDLTTFSFHPVKTIAMGEGGAVTTNSINLKDKLCLFRNHGMERNKNKFETDNQNAPWYYEMQCLGFNFRVSDIHCALGLSQLKKLNTFKEIRKKTVDFYNQAFASLKYMQPIQKSDFSDPAWHLYITFIDYNTIGTSREDLIKLLQDQGIGTQVHYIPVYEQPYYQKLYGKQTLPGCNKFYNTCLSIPLFVDLSVNKQEKVIKEILKYVN